MTPMAHSYTSMKTYDICPLQFWHKKINKTYEEEYSPQILEGWRIHSAFENALLGKKALPKELWKYEGLLRAVPIPCMIEKKLAVDRSFEPCGWMDPDVLYRAVLDVVYKETNNKMLAIDWKTGKVREELDQLKGQAAMLMAHYPNITQVTANFVWLKHSKMTTYELERPQLGETIYELMERIIKIEADDVYEAKPGPLCKWCPAYADCEHAQR